MVRRHFKTLVVVAAASLCTAACSSSTKHAAPTTQGPTATAAAANTTTSSVSTQTYTVGVLTDLTGPAAGIEAGLLSGIKAGIGRAAAEGYNIKYVVGDAQTSPTGALNAAQRLVEQDHVFAIIAISALTFAASNYLTSKGIPVIGSSTDGPEWATAPNMFPVEGAADYHKVWDTIANFMRIQGATNIAALGYGITPSSSLSTKATAVAAESAGLKVGYLNSNFPFGSTNVGPVAIAIKSAGSDGLYAGVVTSTSFALITALRQSGAQLKAAVLPVGYGGDLLSAGPDAESQATGVFFPVSFEPAEMHTAATMQIQHDLQTYAGVSTDPSLNQYFAYASVDAFVQGLKAAGSNPTQSSFTNAMLGITDYTAAGLYGTHSISFALAGRGDIQGPDNCTWFTKFNGKTFDLVPGADPLCGSLLPGKTVS
jgi:branched-chain amino acid transport system substrate-binding protein